MAFNIFALVGCFIIPIALIVCGLWFLNAPPEYGSEIGYKSSRSLSCSGKWYAAHKISGKFFMISGICMMPIAIITVVFFIGGDKDTVGWIAVFEELVQVIVLLAAIPYTENKLKKMQ
ncbi:MAG: SdpI family protein [Huintestinicola sp.]